MKRGESVNDSRSDVRYDNLALLLDQRIIEQSRPIFVTAVDIYAMCDQDIYSLLKAVLNSNN